MIQMMIAAAEPRRIVRGHCQCDVSTSTSLFRVTATDVPARPSEPTGRLSCAGPLSGTVTGSVGLPVSGPVGGLRCQTGSRSLVPNLNASESDAAVTSESSLLSSHRRPPRPGPRPPGPPRPGWPQRAGPGSESGRGHWHAAAARPILSTASHGLSPSRAYHYRPGPA